MPDLKHVCEECLRPLPPGVGGCPDHPLSGRLDLGVPEDREHAAMIRGLQRRGRRVMLRAAGLAALTALYAGVALSLSGAGALVGATAVYLALALAAVWGRERAPPVPPVLLEGAPPIDNPARAQRQRNAAMRGARRRSGRFIDAPNS